MQLVATPDNPIPPGARVEVIGGRLTHPLDNFFVMPALGWTIWNPGVTLQTFAEDDPYVAKLRASSKGYDRAFALVFLALAEADGSFGGGSDPRGGGGIAWA